MSERDTEGVVVVLGELSERDRIAAELGVAVRAVSDVGSVDPGGEDAALAGVVVVSGPEDRRVEAIESLARSYPSVPIVAFVQSEDPTIGSDVVAAGADEYVPAPAFDAPVSELLDRLREDLPARSDARRHRVDVFDAVTDPAVVFGTDGTIRATNEAFRSRFGYGQRAVLGADVADVSVADGGDGGDDPADHVRGAIEAGTRTVEWGVRRADGGVVPTEVALSTVAMDGAERVLGVVRDVSERKRRERELSAERALTETIFSALPDVFYAFDETGQFLRWNDRLVEVTGYDDEAIESMHPIELFPDDERERIAERIATVIEEDTNVTVEASFLTEGGERIPYEFTGGKMTDENGETIGLVGIGRDISDRKRRQRRFEAVFNNTYQFTGLLDPDGTLVEINDAALEFGGLDREDVVGRAVWDVCWFEPYEASIDAVKEAVERARNGEFYRTELTVQGTAGSEIIDFSVRPVTDDEGNVTLLIPEGRTITELKRRERHLDVLHRFLRHNLRNKLTVIDGNAGILEQRLEGAEERSYAALIKGAASELIELGETAHQLSKIVAKADGDRRPVDIAAVISHLTTEFREAHPQATIDARIETDRGVLADWRLEAVLEQLIENAIEHTPTEPTVEVSVVETDDTVSVSVSDDGPGIPEEELVGITTDEEPTPIAHGTGFGLWLVRSVLDDYGANLSYEPNDGGGSTLTVALPKASERGVNAASAEYGES